MIMKKVVAAAQPALAGRTVKDLLIGISLLAVELDNGAVGVSYVLRDSLPNGCSAFPFAQSTIGKSAEEVGGWYLTGANDLQRAVASAVFCAASQALPIPDEDMSGLPFGLKLNGRETVAMVGLIAPIAKALESAAGKMLVFDKGMELHGGNKMLSPCDKMPELLPEADVVIFSGTTTINGSIDGLLELCPKAKEVILVGSSTPMFPAGWQDSRVTRLAGSWWKNENKNELFKAISLGCGIGYIGNYMIKKTALVK